MNEEKIINRNKRIIFTSIVFFVTVIFVLILMNSSFNSEIYFHYAYNQNTGEQLSIFTSLFLYLLFWWFAGLVPSACVFLFMMCVYYFLHRKDRRIMDITCHPEYEEDFFYGGWAAFKVTYFAVLILMILHLSNWATIKVF